MLTGTYKNKITYVRTYVHTCVCILRIASRIATLPLRTTFTIARPTSLKYYLQAPSPSILSRPLSRGLVMMTVGRGMYVRTYVRERHATLIVPRISILPKQARSVQSTNSCTLQCPIVQPTEYVRILLCFAHAFLEPTLPRRIFAQTVRVHCSILIDQTT